MYATANFGRRFSTAATVSLQYHGQCRKPGFATMIENHTILHCLYWNRSQTHRIAPQLRLIAFFGCYQGRRAPSGTLFRRRRVLGRQRRRMAQRRPGRIASVTPSQISGFSSRGAANRTSVSETGVHC